MLVLSQQRRWHTFEPAPIVLQKANLPRFEDSIQGRQSEPLYDVLDDILNVSSSATPDERVVLSAVFNGFDSLVAELRFAAWDEPYVIKQLYEDTYGMKPNPSWSLLHVIGRVLTYNDIFQHIILLGRDGGPQAFFNRVKPQSITFEPTSIRPSVGSRTRYDCKGPMACTGADPLNAWGYFEPDLGALMRFEYPFPYLPQRKMQCCHEFVGESAGCWIALDLNAPLGEPRPYKIFSKDYWDQLVLGDMSPIIVGNFESDIQIGTAWKNADFYTQLHNDVRRLLAQASRALVDAYKRYLVRLNAVRLDLGKVPPLNPYEEDLTSDERSILIEILTTVAIFNEVHNIPMPSDWSSYINESVFKTRSVASVWTIEKRNVVSINGRTVNLLDMSSVSDQTRIAALVIALSGKKFKKIRNLINDPYQKRADAYRANIEPMLNQVTEVRLLSASSATYQEAFYNEAISMRDALIVFQREANTAVRAVVNNTTPDMTPLNAASVAIPAGVTVPKLDIPTARAKYLAEMVTAYANANRVNNAGYNANAINTAIAAYQKVGTTSVILQGIPPFAQDGEKNAINAARLAYEKAVQQQRNIAGAAIAQGNELIEEGNSIQNALAHYASDLARGTDVTSKVEQMVNTTLVTDIQDFTKVANANAGNMEGVITKALAAYNKTVADVKAAIDARLVQLRASVVTYINATFNTNAKITKLETIQADIDNFRDKLTANDKFKDLLGSYVNDIIAETVTPYERVHRDVVSRIEESIKKDAAQLQKEKDAVTAYFAEWDRISEDVWYTEVKAYLLALARGNTPSSLKKADTTTLETIINVFETAEQRQARLAREAAAKKAIQDAIDADQAYANEFFAWTNIGSVDRSGEALGKLTTLEDLYDFTKTSTYKDPTNPTSNQNTRPGIPKVRDAGQTTDYSDVRKALLSIPGFERPSAILSRPSGLPGSFQDNTNIYATSELPIGQTQQPFNALYVEGFQTKDLVVALNTYGEYLLLEMYVTPQERAVLKKKALDAIAAARVNPLPEQPEFIEVTSNPKDTFPISNGRFAAPSMLPGTSLFTFTAPQQGANSCWLDSSIVSLFSIPQTTWVNALFNATEIRKRAVKMIFKGGRTQIVTPDSTCRQDQLQGLHSALIVDILTLEGAKTTTREMCQVRTHLSKARDCLVRSPLVEGEQESPETFYDSFVQLYGSDVLGIEYVTHDWTADGALIDVRSPAATTRAVIINASQYYQPNANLTQGRTQFTVPTIASNGFRLAAIVCKSGGVNSGHFTTFIYDFAVNKWAYFDVIGDNRDVGWVDVIAKSRVPDLPEVPLNSTTGLPKGALDFAGITAPGAFVGKKPAFFVYFKQDEIDAMVANWAAANVLGIPTPTPSTDADILQELGFSSGVFPTDPAQKTIVEQHVAELKNYNGTNRPAYVAERTRIMKVRLSELPLSAPPAAILPMEWAELGFTSVSTDPIEVAIVNQYVRETSSLSSSVPYKEERLRIAKIRLEKK